MSTSSSPKPPAKQVLILNRKPTAEELEDPDYIGPDFADWTRLLGAWVQESGEVAVIRIAAYEFEPKATPSWWDYKPLLPHGAASAGGWDPWTREMLSRCDAFVVPVYSPNAAVVGRATGQMVEAALKAGKLVYALQVKNDPELGVIATDEVYEVTATAKINVPGQKASWQRYIVLTCTDNEGEVIPPLDPADPRCFTVDLP